MNQLYLIRWIDSDTDLKKTFTLNLQIIIAMLHMTGKLIQNIRIQNLLINLFIYFFIVNAMA